MAALRGLVCLTTSALRSGFLTIPATRLLSSSVPLMVERYIPGKSRESPTQLRGKLVDDSDNVAENIESLSIAQDQSTGEFQLYPDEMTADTLFNGVKYSNLPYVTINLTLNNTRFQVHNGSDEQIYYTTVKEHGFINAKKRTSVAAQVTGLAVGQKLRSMNIKTVRCRVAGFNAGRIAAIKGINQAGINIVSISDVTIYDWGWSRRAKKRPRRN